MPPPLGRDLPQLLPRHTRNSPSCTLSHTQLERFRPLPWLRGWSSSPLTARGPSRPLCKKPPGKGEPSKRRQLLPRLSSARFPFPGKLGGYFQKRLQPGQKLCLAAAADATQGENRSSPEPGEPPAPSPIPARSMNGMPRSLLPLENRRGGRGGELRQPSPVLHWTGVSFRVANQRFPGEADQPGESPS